MLQCKIKVYPSSQIKQKKITLNIFDAIKTGDFNAFAQI